MTDTTDGHEKQSQEVRLESMDWLKVVDDRLMECDTVWSVPNLLMLRSTFFLRLQGSYRREDLLSRPAQNPLDHQALVSVVLREVTIPPRSCAPASLLCLCCPVSV